jgi:hypothetical protein
VAFGEAILNKSEVTDRIWRAQTAILNPSTNATHYLSAPLGESNEREVSFSSNSVCLHITGKEVEDLSFVDLPGDDNSRIARNLLTNAL